MGKTLPDGAPDIVTPRDPNITVKDHDINKHNLKQSGERGVCIIGFGPVGTLGKAIASILERQPIVAPLPPPGEEHCKKDFDAVSILHNTPPKGSLQELLKQLSNDIAQRVSQTKEALLSTIYIEHEEKYPKYSPHPKNIKGHNIHNKKYISPHHTGYLRKYTTGRRNKGK